jgi:zona occludens toxin
MSLTFVTGVPGAGKTAFGVDLLLDLVKGTDETGPRPLYVIEVPDPNCPPIDLKIPHTLLGEQEGHRWQEIVPDGAVVFMPEVQRLWKPRHSSREPGPDLMALETHRHRGIDLVIDTQHPRMVDAHVKSVGGRHVHLRDTGWLGRWLYEWPEVQDTIPWKTCVQKRKWKLPKRVFGLYKSASLHVKPVKGVPPMAYVAAVLVLSTLVLGVMIYRSISSKLAPDKPAQVEASSKGVTGSGFKAPAVIHQEVTAVSLLEEAQPRLSARPETAPMYDHLRVVAVMPRIVGGYCQGNVCRCFTQQFTDPGIGPDACRAWLKSPPFDPYRVEQQGEEQRPQARSVPVGAGASEPGGVL